jgi:hypothetical protein
MSEKYDKIVKELNDYKQKYEDFKKKAVARKSNDQFYRSSNSSSSNRFFMYKDAIIYHDIIEALEKNIISKIGNPSGWDENSWRVNLWNKRKLLKIGTQDNAIGNGITTTIPEGYDTLWLRVINDQWVTVKCNFLDGDKDYIGNFASGKRNLNEYSPDGAAPDSAINVHMWIPIPAGRSGKVGIYSGRGGDSWISGIAFGKNIWNHARNPALAYHWILNGGTETVWHSDKFFNDPLSHMPGGKAYDLKVPVVYSGKDKLVYIIEHNSDWTGTYHTSVSVNGVNIERFRTTYTNPFATHHNTKPWSRYIAARVPADLIKKEDRFITLRMDFTAQNPDNNFHFREIGTHDYFE